MMISVVKAEDPPVVEDEGGDSLTGVYVALVCIFVVNLLWIVSWYKLRSKQMKAHEESKKIFLTKQDMAAKNKQDTAKNLENMAEDTPNSARNLIADEE